MKLIKPSRRRSIELRAPFATKSKPSRVIGIASWSALLITLATLVLTLLGYGHDIAYLEAVGLRSEELQRTPLELLQRSWHSVLYFSSRFPDVMTMQFQQFFWENLLFSRPILLMILLGLPVFSAVMAWTFFTKPWHSTRTDGLQVISRVRRTSRMKDAIVRYRQWISYPTRKWGYAGWIAWPVFFGGILALLLVSLTVVAFVILGVVAVPLMGASSGELRAQQEVLAPVGCIGQHLKAGQDRLHQARCVRVLRDGDELARGYLIDYGAGRIFLYQPCVKRSLSLSLERTVIEQIHTLEFAAPSKLCHASLLAYKKSH
jgi:hypothetical protein